MTKYPLQILIQLLFTLVMYAMAVLFFGISLMPGLAMLLKTWDAVHTAPLWQKTMCLGFALSAGFFLFGITLVLLVGTFRMVSGLKLKEGEYKMHEPEALKWSFLSCLYSMIRYTFIDFILLTPFANLLFRMLGAKLGKNVAINSSFVFDHSLLEIDDGAVIGGGAIIDAHIFERGKLILRKVKIGKQALIGSHCTLMPGCEIGDKAIISANALLLKDSKVEPRDIWVGIPAESLRAKKRAERNRRKERESEDT
ncbi:MAG: hypothetical protein KC897_11540 [Candidatus Omnitrophica bacterium]|nr:hypothetical protein [Candidatus Omnitrophota bacterium]MCB9719333.1 hypothetical protein [Candidatus Omnitrophota bacterium]